MIQRSILAALATLAAGSILAAGASATTVSRWGSYLVGSNETGPKETQTSPTPVALGEVEMIDASNASSFALKTDGTVWAWGDGRAGQLGDGSRKDSVEPVQVDFPKGVFITTIGEAKDEGYAIDSTGQAWTWGLGRENSGCMRGQKRTRPEMIPGLNEVVAVQGGQNHVVWLKRDGTVLGCGTNQNGQLGLGDEVANAPTPTPIPGLQSIVQISTGNRTLEARDSSGNVFMSGENGSGQVGIGSSEPDVYTVAEVPLPEPAVSISAGGDLVPNGTSFAVTSQAVYGWGDDASGQVGDGQTSSKLSPVATGLHFTSVAAGGTFALGLDSEGNVYSWGSNAGGSLGIGGKRARSTKPMLVQSGVSAISATARNALDIDQ